MVLILNGIQKSESQEIWTIGCHFVRKQLKSGYKFLDFEWSGFHKVGTNYSYSHSLSPTILNLKHLKSDFQKNGFEMFLEFKYSGDLKSEQLKSGNI